MIVSVTGHRPKSLGWGYRRDRRVTQVKQDIETHLKRYHATEVITGMALGFDQWVAETASNLKVPFIAAVPFRGQASSWPEPSRQHWRMLLSNAAQIFCVNISSVRPFTYEEFLALEVEDVSYNTVRRWLYARNTWMVKRADQVLTLWNGGPGGTKHTVLEAEQNNIHIFNIFRDEYREGVVPNGTR